MCGQTNELSFCYARAELIYSWKVVWCFKMVAFMI